MLLDSRTRRSNPPRSLVAYLRRLLRKGHRFGSTWYPSHQGSSAKAADAGDEFINNFVTDLAPLLALFGERVATQFMSESFTIADSIIFAVAPLGIMTAMVGAIRVGGPNEFRAIIGRAKESRSTVELELMSSTSTEVCELWNGDGIVRVLGRSIIELIYVVPDDDNPNISEQTALQMWQDDLGIYGFDSALNQKGEKDFWSVFLRLLPIALVDLYIPIWPPIFPSTWVDKPFPYSSYGLLQCSGWCYSLVYYYLQASVSLSRIEVQTSRKTVELPNPTPSP